jgi:hypothetical protein
MLCQRQYAPIGPGVRSTSPTFFRGNRQIALPLRVVRVGFAETVSDGERGLMTDKRCGQVARGGRPAPILGTGVTWMGRSLAAASELAPPRAAMAAGAIQGLLADNEPTLLSSGVNART